MVLERKKSRERAPKTTACQCQSCEERWNLYRLWLKKLKPITSAGECQPARPMAHITLLHSAKKVLCPRLVGVFQLRWIGAF